MNNLLVMPLLLPLCTAVALIFLKDRIVWQRFVGAIGALANIAVACLIVVQVREKGIQTLDMGGWAPPYGIVFVADMLAALLVLTTAVIGFVCLLFSFRSVGESRERNYFHPVFQFLLVGVYGSFLTGDIFNLFVCFEVMLISSYALIVLGGTKRQLRETLKYILINILSSTLFVAAVAYLYASVGTLNMAHLAERVAESGQGGILNVIAVMFLLVFSLKAGLFLFFWLPGSYAAPPTAVRAVFAALLTKVGLYAIIRTFTLIFYHEPAISHSLIGWMAGATMILGSIGAIAYRDVSRVLNYNIVIAVGFIGFGVSVATEEALGGVAFYLMHDMVAKALLFLLGGMIAAAAGTEKLKEMGGLIGRYPLLGWMFFATALALVGVPPLSGFAGKAMILRSGFSEGAYALSAIGLASSFVVLYSLMNVFRHAFWGKTPAAAPEKIGLRWSAGAAAGLFALVVAIGLGSEWVLSYVAEAGYVLSRPEVYIDAVLRG